MPANPFDVCLHCGRPRRRVVRSQKRAHAHRKKYGALHNAFIPHIQIYCVTPTRTHQFSKDTK